MIDGKDERKLCVNMKNENTHNRIEAPIPSASSYDLTNSYIDLR